MKLDNMIHVSLILAAMLSLLGGIGWVLAGRDGLLITMGFGALFTVFGRGASKTWMLNAIGAVKLNFEDAPNLFDIVKELAQRAGLEQLPDLYLLDSETMFGFSAGSGEDDAAIVLTGPLVQNLSAREVAGVLAHEIAHIHGGDLVVMGMADLVTRMTRTLSLLGIVLVILNVPLALSLEGGRQLPWTALLLLVSAPMVNFMMQMALSRVREFDADVGAVDLCGDPPALATALEKLERQSNGLFRTIFMPHKPGTEPSLLRSHPITQERVKRILSQSPAVQPLPESLIGEHHGFPPGWATEWNGNVTVPIRWLMRWWR
jgi:heat shock protein HtpX